MNGKQRMRAAIEGQPVDRVPIWLREGFEFDEPIPRADHFTEGWKSDPAYIELFKFAREYCDMRVGWGTGGHLNRTLGIPPRYIHGKSETIGPDLRRQTTVVDTPKGQLISVGETRRGVKTGWRTKYLVESIEDLNKLRSVPFEVAPVTYDGYERALRQVGDRGVLCLGVSSPWVVLASCMSYEQSLEWVASERAMIHEVLEEITQRVLACLDAILSRPLDTIANVGGSEQCTPPMMSPDAYAEFVTPYDGRLVARLTAEGIPVSCHCHGRVAKALREMVKMGFSATDPVEPPFNGGDVTIAQARAIVGDRLTLCGNLQFCELERESPEAIRARVREILATGKRRLVLAASAGPISRTTLRLLANYRAWIEEALLHGACEA